MSSKNHQTAITAWIDHTSLQREETETVILAGLVNAYPDHHITRTNAAKCDVLAYAVAGFATADPGEDPGVDATRLYRAPSSRLNDAKGKLEDVVSFGKWNYTYQDNKFIVYEIAYMDKFGRIIKPLYILAPSPSSDDIDGLHHKKVDALLTAAGIWTQDVHEQVWVYDDQEWSKSSSLWRAVQGTTWDDVVLEPSMRSKLHRDVHGFFDNQELYRKARIPWKRGIIFHGVPGNGKSMTLAVTINELAKRDPPIPALYVKSLDACAGPKWSLQEIFNKARRTAPCLLVLEDLDSLVTDNTRSYFLNEVDGLESNDGILIIGSTNHLDRLDTSVTKRPSRFDRKYHFKLPEEAERLAYCRYWRNKFADSDEVVEFSEELCVVVAKWTEGYSFAYLKELFVTALLLHTHGLEGEEDRDEDEDGGEQAEKEEDEKMGKQNDAETATANGEPAKPTATQSTEQTAQLNGEATKPDLAQKDQTTTSSTDKPNSTDPPKPKRILPNIFIPTSLHSNPLLKIFRTQAQTLLEEMDHATSSGEKKPAGPPQDPPIKFRIPSMIDDEGDEESGRSYLG